MAKIEMGILGGFSGRVGTVVGYYRRGGWYVRAYQPNIRDRRSAAQLQQRSRFKAMIMASSQLLGAIRLGLRERAQRAGLTEGNVFLQLNKQHFTDVAVDYAGLQLSTGTMPQAAYRGYRLVDGVLEVDFERNSRMRGAKVQVVAYDGERCAVAEAVSASLGHVRMALPDGWDAAATHVYAFTVGADGCCSRTAYLSINQGDDGSPCCEGDASGEEGADAEGCVREMRSRSGRWSLSPPS